MNTQPSRYSPGEAQAVIVGLIADLEAGTVYNEDKVRACLRDVLGILAGLDPARDDLASHFPMAAPVDVDVCRVLMSLLRMFVSPPWQLADAPQLAQVADAARRYLVGQS